MVLVHIVGLRVKAQHRARVKARARDRIQVRVHTKTIYPHP